METSTFHQVLTFPKHQGKRSCRLCIRASAEPSDSRFWTDWRTVIGQYRKRLLTRQKTSRQKSWQGVELKEEKEDKNFKIWQRKMSGSGYTGKTPLSFITILVVFCHLLIPFSSLFYLAVYSWDVQYVSRQLS